jgi:hypothetical protein
MRRGATIPNKRGDKVTEDDFKRIESMMTRQLARQLGGFVKRFQQKFDQLSEGQQFLVERMDRMASKLRGVDQVREE